MQSMRGSKLAGEFEVGSAAPVHGEVTLNGSNSVLQLVASERFDARSLRGGNVRGVLHDLTKVTAIDCVGLEGPSTRTYRGASRYSAKLFPHFLAFGSDHFDPNHRTIRSVHFVIDEATSLYYDFDAFGMVLNPEQYIEAIANANVETTQRSASTGPDPQILYFSGKTGIFVAETSIGRVSATHNPGWCLPDPSGLRLSNQITTDIAFSDDVKFDEAIARILILLGFLNMVIGRPQNVTHLRIVAVGDPAASAESPQPTEFQVYWSWAPTRESKGEGRHSHSADVLVNPVQTPGEFSSTLARWLEKDGQRRLARAAFRQSFADQLIFSPIRLVGAANMFDVLLDTDSSASKPDAVPADVQTAKAECTAIFKKLGKSELRSAALDAIGRIGRLNLRQKIQERADCVSRELAGRLPDIDLVVAETVKFRNYLVHGTEAKRDYGNHFPFLSFMTETLEFVFGASELIESGWNIRRWAEAGSSGTHPFGEYLVNYRQNLSELKEWIAKRSGLDEGPDVSP